MGGRTTLSLSSQAGQERNLDTGFYGWGAGVSGNFEFTPGGKLDGSSQSVDFLAKFQTEEQRDERLRQYTEEMEHILDRIGDDGSRLISLTDIDELKRLHGLIQQEYDYTITGGSTPAWGSPCYTGACIHDDSDAWKAHLQNRGLRVCVCQNPCSRGSA